MKNKIKTVIEPVNNLPADKSSKSQSEELLRRKAAYASFKSQVVTLSNPDNSDAPTTFPGLINKIAKIFKGCIESHSLTKSQARQVLIYAATLLLKVLGAKRADVAKLLISRIIAKHE